MSNTVDKINSVLEKLSKIEECILGAENYVTFYWFKDFSTITYNLPGIDAMQKAITYRKKLIPTNHDEIGSFIYIIDKVQEKKEFLNLTELKSLISEYSEYIGTLIGRTSYLV